MMLDFLNHPIAGSKHFTWGQALWLPQWKVHVFPLSNEIAENIVGSAEKMELIRAYLDRHIQTTSWYRPTEYNSLIKGAPFSAHRIGKAVDFVVPGMTAQAVRDRLYPKLIEFDIRMEKLPKSNWIHIDTATRPDMSLEDRYFNP